MPLHDRLLCLRFCIQCEGVGTIPNDWHTEMKAIILPGASKLQHSFRRMARLPSVPLRRCCCFNCASVVQPPMLGAATDDMMVKVRAECKTCHLRQNCHCRRCSVATLQQMWCSSEGMDESSQQHAGHRDVDGKALLPLWPPTHCHGDNRNGLDHAVPSPKNSGPTTASSRNTNPHAT